MTADNEEALRRYGQEFIEETPELLSSKLKELEAQLEQFPEDKKKWYSLALKKAPDECNRKFKLKHLRCEVFRVKDATKRIIAYWNKRVEIFGNEKAFQPLTLTSALNKDSDKQALEIAFMRLTFQKDDAGRGIVFVDPSRLPKKGTYDKKSMIRAFWYNVHAILEDEEIQRKGVVIIAHPRHLAHANFDRSMSKMHIESLRGCLPLRVAAIHICHPPWFFKLVFAVLKLFLGERMRKKVKPHSGEDETVLLKMQRNFGISKDKIPSEMGGGLVLDQVVWLEERRSKGL